MPRSGGYTDDDICRLGAAIAGAVAPLFLTATFSRQQLVTIIDEQGWNITHHDVSSNYKLLEALLIICPCYVPALSYLSASIETADKVLLGRILMSDTDDSLKYACKIKLFGAKRQVFTPKQ